MYEAVEPPWTVAIAELPDGTASPRPVPGRLAVCGLPAPLSAIANVPLRNPVAIGVKLTLIVQLALTMRRDGQLLVSAKSFGEVPAIEILLIVRLALPVLDKVTS